MVYPGAGGGGVRPLTIPESHFMGGCVTVNMGFEGTIWRLTLCDLLQ